MVISPEMWEVESSPLGLQWLPDCQQQENNSVFFLVTQIVHHLPCILAKVAGGEIPTNLNML